MIEILGYIAAFLTTFSFLPQAYKVYKTNHTKDLSILMFSMLITGIFLWFVYGLLIKSNPIIYANGITLILSSYILIKIIKNIQNKV